MSPGNFSEEMILEAAAEVFAEKGYAGARVDEIAETAGVNKAMLYYRVGDKKELYRRVVLRGQKGFREAMLQAFENSSNATETLRNVVGSIVENATSHRLIPSIILRELAGKGATLPDEGVQGIRGFLETVRSIITMGVEEGSFRAVDPVAMQFMVTGGVFMLALSSELRLQASPADPGPVTSGEISTALVDILSRGILVKGADE